MALTPIDFKAAMLAMAGTSVGKVSWWTPCLAKKATLKPEAVLEIVMAEDGAPHGVEMVNLATGVRDSKW
ncbi:hypothetical protein WICPIJ_002868 [Wickerhamomyces pijperi]|uniref:Uncharacterized protein n=1 Tax=Wickerhamomyces pijperi TaxID=599730 RepID=A0A9P8QB09_WICPI|nr:hypothetical protein WICPIJ_002868 [Wickerhamomyces pijperi]